MHAGDMTRPFERLPARVGPFDITGLLGEGGMGVVYSARTARGDLVAVKTVPSVDATLRSTLRREIHALSRLAHPGVVRVLASGVDGGRPWYAMELLQGATLGAMRDSLWGDVLGLERTHISGGGTDQMPTVAMLKRTGADPHVTPPIHQGRTAAAGGQLDRVLAMTRRLLGTLAFIHGEGIVHRDLKPSNVFLRPGDQPVLVDFGLAWRSAGTVGREVVDDAMEVVGTPAYMAPEQIRADLVDSRADLYALGCLLYELLTGRPPFVGTSAVVMEQHLAIAPAPPSEHVDGISRALDALVLELLEKKPRHRTGHAIDAIYQLEAIGVPAEKLPIERPRAYVHRPALAGRDAALDVLERATHNASKGQGGVVLIAGESGMGKTYLAMEAARRAATFQLITGTCAQRQPLAPLGRLFDVVVDRCTAGGRRETDRLLGPGGRILAHHWPELARLPGQDHYAEPTMLFGPAARDRMLAALADTIGQLAAVQPVLLLLDDLQWADEVTMRFLSSLADDWFEQQRVLVIGTYRVEEATPAISELGARPYAQEVRLDKLDETVVRSLVCDMLAIETPPPPFVSFLARHSEGNPFFVAEYLRTATAEGLIRRGAGRRIRFGQEGAGDSANVEMLGQLPVTMPELVGRRLDGLSPVARKLAACASVVGREFDPEVVSDAAGASENDALEAIAELVARQVLETSEDGALRFVHDKLHEIAYGRQDEATRRTFHRAVGEATLRRFAEPERARHYASLAHHFLIAGVDDRALEFLEKAGERALVEATYGEACDLYRKLLALDDKRRDQAVEPRRRARWERRLGEACFNLGDLAGCEEHSLAAMRRLGCKIPDRGSTFGAMAALAKMAGRQTLHRAGVGTGNVTEDEARDDLREIALAAAVMAWRYFFVDDMVGVVSMSLLSVNEIERASPPLQLASPYAWLGYTSGIARLHAPARFYFGQAHAAANATGDLAGGHFASLMEALYHVGFARWPDAERLNRASLEELRDAGDPTNAEHHLTCLANLEMYTGRFDESIRHFEQILRAARARRNLQHVAWGLYASCKGMIAQGRFDESLPRLDEAKALLDTLADAASLIITHGLYALLHVRRGEDDKARAMADETAARIAKSRAVVYSTILGYIGCAETYVELYGRRRGPELLEKANAACAGLRKFALVFPFAEPAAVRYTAQLQAIEGKSLRARRGLEKAASLARSLSMPYDEAQALWLEGRYFGDRRRLGAARVIFDRLGCAWHREQT
jgi:serine/threonine protein kinase/tetratricopeptide (TPR) repeat protein